MQRNDPMKAYMQDIGEIPLISKDEEIELAALIKTGDDAARQKLIKANLRLVVKIAHDFKGLGLPLLDLISEGNIGLMRAAEKFDPAKGAKFSSYSAWWIKQSMRRALSQKSRTIRVPVASAGKITKIRQARTLLTDRLGRPPTDTELADSLEFTRRTINGLKMADFKTFSLNDPIQKGEDGSFEDIIPDTTSATPAAIIEDNESLLVLRRLVDKLDEREQTILSLRYGLQGQRPKTLEEVSHAIGRTRERVRQIQMQALRRLRALLEEETPAEASQHPGASTAVQLLDALAATATPARPTATPAPRGKRGRGTAALTPLAHGEHDPLCQCATPLAELSLSHRCLNGLASIGVTTVAQLLALPCARLTTIRYFGDKCRGELHAAMDALRDGHAH